MEENENDAFQNHEHEPGQATEAADPVCRSIAHRQSIPASVQPGGFHNRGTVRWGRRSGGRWRDWFHFCVRGLGLGVFGAALATMLAQLLAGVGCLGYAMHTNPYFLFERSRLGVDWEIIRHAVRLGLPLALQWSMIAVSTTALQTVVNRFGTTAVAAFTATNRIDQLTQQPFGSLGMALSTYAGQNYGARRLDRVREGVKDAMLVMAVFSGAMLIVIQLLGPDIVRAFVSDGDVVTLGGKALRLTSWFYVFLGTIFVIRGALNGVGDTLFSFINGIIEMLCRIFLPMGLMMLLSENVWVIWWTAGLTWAVSALACLLRYVWWRRKSVGKA
jgi:Na+-driven multidrug efflux pump